MTVLGRRTSIHKDGGTGSTSSLVALYNGRLMGRSNNTPVTDKVAVAAEGWAVDPAPASGIGMSELTEAELAAGCGGPAVLLKAAPAVPTALAVAPAAGTSTGSGPESLPIACRMPARMAVALLKVP